MFFVVSIQRLFGFVMLEKIMDTVNVVFQYNDCLGSSAVFKSITYQNSLFQYNDCLGSSL